MMALGSLGSEGRRHPMHEINVVPLVDVMLVLLVIFIVTAPLLTHAVKIDLPRASSQPNQIRADHVEIAVRRDGSLVWNGEPVTRAELEQRAAALAANASDTEVHLYGDTAAPYGDMAGALAVLARHGLTRIGFVTDPREAGS